MASIPNPLALIAELTHRCPLHCVYCSNPLELSRRAEELPTEVWSRVFHEAAQLGVLQADFTGGEPLARTDILELIRAARAAGLYVNLITSGMPLDEARITQLIEAGLDHLQLSFQAAREETAQEISNTKSHAQKLRVLEWLKKVRVAVTLNFVIHRRNIDQIEEMLQIAESSSATRIEFANVQYYGWAFANRESLLPTKAQLDRSLEVIKSAEARLRGKIRIESVVPDYYAKYPKPCMGGWGRKLMLITPNGDALPCHAAKVIPGLRIRQCERKQSARNLGEFAGVPKISRRRLDASPLQDLRPPHHRLRRLPLPSPPPSRRCRRHRSGLLAVPQPSQSRRHPIHPQRACRGGACLR